MNLLGFTVFSSSPPNPACSSQRCLHEFSSSALLPTCLFIPFLPATLSHWCILSTLLAPQQNVSLLGPTNISLLVSIIFRPPSHSLSLANYNLSFHQSHPHTCQASMLVFGTSPRNALIIFALCISRVMVHVSQKYGRESSEVFQRRLGGVEEGFLQIIAL